MDAIDLAGLRREYETQGLRRAELHPDPIEQFATWFSTAVNSGLPDANAIALATATPDGKPSARVVLLKGFDQRGFVFFTNYESKKGHELEKNPEAAFVVYWMQLERQIRVTGRVEKTSRAESERYFHERPRGSQLGAWVSRQSEVIDARRILDARLEEMTQRFAGSKDDRAARRTGAATGSSRQRSNSGRAAPTACTTAFATPGKKDGSWTIERLAP